MNDRGTQEGSNRNMPAPASIASFICALVRIDYLISRLLVLQRNAEGVERVVVGGEEYVTVANRHAGQVRIGSDCVSARIQFLAGSSIESVERCMAGVIAPIESKHYSVGDRRRRRILEIARDPTGSQHR